jgi:hypothetical protein
LTVATKNMQAFPWFRSAEGPQYSEGCVYILAADFITLTTS